MFARLIFAFVSFAARKGLTETQTEQSPKDATASAKDRARRTIGCDGPTLAFVEVKTRDVSQADLPAPEHAVNSEKRRHLARMARHFLRWRRMESNSWRFDLVAVETRPGKRPVVRLHKGAFLPDSP